MIPLPSKPEIVSEDGHRAVIEIEGLYPGYGHTIGNAMRRVLLSSLKGAAITSVKIEGAGHEFTAIEGIAEDIVDLTLNLKQLRFRLYEDGPFTISLAEEGIMEVTGRDFKTPSQVELVTPDVHIASLTSKRSRISLDAVVESGFGFVPIEARSKEKVEVGTIALDAAFSPVRHVNYEVENMRVGDRTDYHRLRLHIEIDGSMSAREAFTRATGILTDQFSALAEGFGERKSRPAAPTSPVRDHEGEPDGKEGASEPGKMKLDDIKLSSRTHNALREAGIKTVGGLARKRAAALGEIEGIGEKGIQEIKKALGNLGIILKP